MKKLIHNRVAEIDQCTHEKMIERAREKSVIYRKKADVAFEAFIYFGLILIGELILFCLIRPKATSEIAIVFGVSFILTMFFLFRSWHYSEKARLYKDAHIFLYPQDD